MVGIFKAYDIRGLYPQEINEPIAEAIGGALPFLLRESGGSTTAPIVVSRDMRPHSPALLDALARGILAAGRDVLDIGLATTPMNYFAVGSTGAAAGVQVTASHNPAAYNGLKLSLHEARPVSGDFGIPLLERRVLSGERVSAEQPGKRRTGEVFAAYSEHLLSLLERPAGARRLVVVADAANGMGTLYRPLLERAGIELVPLYFELDGTFPNHEANPLKVENQRDLAAAVGRHRADLGVAFDGDADRAVFVDDRGTPVGSDLTTALIAGELLRKHGPGIVVYDVRSSRAVAEFIREHGGTPRRERVGHSFIKATLRERKGIFGGELAGHYYFRDNYFADCSLLAVFEILNLLWRSGRSLSALLTPLRRYAKSEEINFLVQDKAGAMARLAERYRDGRIDRLDGVTVDCPDWWFNVRPSNTEPLLRLVIEAEDQAALARRRAELVALLGAPEP